MYGVYTAGGNEIERFRSEKKANEVAKWYAQRQFSGAYYKEIIDSDKFIEEGVVQKFKDDFTKETKIKIQNNKRKRI